ncbi:Transposase, MuDR, plant [Sesbania bispinosa]|nr:Transposase, MuDR, plant [Sesbania bispinosa]
MGEMRVLGEMLMVLPPSNVENKYTMEGDYESEELLSGTETSDGEARPKYPRFHKEDICKQIKWKVGIEFGSLGEFKDAMLEHNILNGKEVKFVKDDLVRARAVCTRKCPFTVLYSKVGGSETFRIKTLHGRHKCGRVFNNKNANSKWIAKVVVDKFRTSSNVKLTKIIEDVRKTTVLELLSRKLGRLDYMLGTLTVDGDVSQQYTLLWDYSAELRRVNLGNTCKIQLERVSPDTPSYRPGGNQGKPPLLSKVRGNQRLKGKQSKLVVTSSHREPQGEKMCLQQKRAKEVLINKGGNQWKRGKKKSLPPSPVIPEFARHMFVGQLVTKLTQVWVRYLSLFLCKVYVESTTSEQAAALAAEDAANPVPTSAGEVPEPTIPANQAQAPTISAKSSSMTGTK